MRRLGVGIAVVAAAALVASAAFAAQSPRSRFDALLANARAERSVHYVYRHSLGADSFVRIKADVTRSRGIQHIRETIGKRSSGIEVVVVGDATYARGGRRGLEDLVGLNSAKAKRFAHRWISIPKGDYQGLADGGTLPSLVRDLAPAPHLRYVERQAGVGGTKMIEIRAIAKDGELDLVARPRGRLPVEAIDVAGGGTGSTELSHWNEAVHVQAPAGAVVLATVRG